MRALQQQAWSKQYRRKEEEHRTEGTEKKKQKEIKQKQNKSGENHKPRRNGRRKRPGKRRRAKHRNCPKQRLLPRSPGPVSSSPSSLSFRSPISLSLFSLSLCFIFAFISFHLLCVLFDLHCFALILFFLWFDSLCFWFFL